MTLHKHPEPVVQPKQNADTGQSATSGLRFVFPGNPVGVRNALSGILGGLQFLELSADEYGTIELVLAEVMNNIVEHAYADNPDGIIELVIMPTNSGLFCIVCDDGNPMPDGNVPMGCKSSVDCEVDGLPEGGFGWFLIRDLARDIEYTRSSHKNRLSFRILVGTSRFQMN